MASSFVLGLRPLVMTVPVKVEQNVAKYVSWEGFPDRLCVFEKTL